MPAPVMPTPVPAAAFQRYALYFTLGPGPLGDFGARWLGWDSASGTECPRPEVPNLDPARIVEITKRPHKYGFHATLKPPFRLADGTDADRLGAQLQAFCQSNAPVALPPLEVGRLGRMLALTLTAPCPAMTDLAAKIVRAFDPFRAPMTPAEWDRRTRHPLSPDRLENLKTWGYPHVMDAFKFHMTLTDPLPRDALDPVAEALTQSLNPMLTPKLAPPVTLDAISLLGEAPSGRFHLITRVPLGAQEVA